MWLPQNDTKNAFEYLSRFAKFIRMTLENSSKKRIQLLEEIEFLENYLSLEKRRVLNISFSFKVAPDIDSDAIKIPPMVIQPLIEKSIICGISHIKREGKIVIEYKLDNDKLLHCIIEDNGSGRIQSRVL